MTIPATFQGWKKWQKFKTIAFMLTGFPAAAYAAYAAGRGYSGYPSFGLPYPTGNHLSLNHLNHHNTAHIAPLNLNLNHIQAAPTPHHNPPTPTALFYHPNLDLYNAMPLWTNSSSAHTLTNRYHYRYSIIIIIIIIIILSINQRLVIESRNICDKKSKNISYTKWDTSESIIILI